MISQPAATSSPGAALRQSTARPANGCTNPRHDHTTTDDRTGGFLETPIPMRCASCDQPSFYDEATGGYQHDDPQAPACDQVRHTEVGNPCWLPIRPQDVEPADLWEALSDLRDTVIAVHATDDTGSALIHGTLIALPRRRDREPHDDINLVVTDFYGGACWLIPVHGDTVHLIQRIPMPTQAVRSSQAAADHRSTGIS